MEMVIRENDNFRINTPQNEHFIDVRGCGYQGLSVTGYPSFHYIEVRRKSSHVATFYWKSKRHKKEADLGWWSDSEVLLAINEVYHKEATNERHEG